MVMAGYLLLHLYQGELCRWNGNVMCDGRDQSRGGPAAMSTRPEADIREELRLVEEDLAQVRETAVGLRRRIGERADEPTDEAERAALIESADEQEALVFRLEARRDQLQAALSGRSS